MQKAEGRMQNEMHGRRLARILFCILHSAFCLCFSGCSNNAAQKPATRPMTADEKQEAALRDPFSYSPYDEKHDISGGEIGDLDKDALKRDLDHVFNP